MPTRRVILLGSTGSIGTQTLEVIDHLNREHDAGRWATRFEVVALAAGRNASVLFDQAERLGVRELALRDPVNGVTAQYQNVRTGDDAAEALVREVEADLVVAAMVGFAGLGGTLAAVQRGSDVALANKETLVAAGALIVPEALRSGARLLPIDSEHSAIWQCMGEESPPFDAPERVARVVLTASGGPFHGRAPEEVYDAEPAAALDHPNWNMGDKVTIDSATLTNKAFELIEAHWLFGFGPERLGAVIHPQSVVHSFVEFADGSVLAQLGEPDMRAPIQYALTHPGRAPASARRMEIESLGSLGFEPIDSERRGPIDLAFEAMRRGGTLGAVFNGANEAAVRAFLERRIPFGRIVGLVREAFEAIGRSEMRSLDDACAGDAEGRAFVEARTGA